MSFVITYIRPHFQKSKLEQQKTHTSNPSLAFCGSTTFWFEIVSFAFQNVCSFGLPVDISVIETISPTFKICFCLLSNFNTNNNPQSQLRVVRWLKVFGHNSCSDGGNVYGGLFGRLEVTAATVNLKFIKNEEKNTVEALAKSQHENGILLIYGF